MTSVPAEFEHAERGDYVAAQALVDSGGPWSIAARGLLALLRSDSDLMPTPAQVSPASGDSAEVRLAKAVAAHSQMRALTLAHRVEQATEWLELVRRNAQEGGASLALLAAVSVHWMNAFDGKAQGSSVEPLAGELRSNAHAAWLLDLRAASIMSLPAEDADTVLASARRLARMSRTEGIVDRELIATIVLARARRLAGQPYLAVRILDQIARFAPRLYQPSVAVEMTLSGGGTPPGVDLGRLDPLEPLLQSALEGNRGEFDRLRTETLSVSGTSLWSDELRVLMALLDPDDPDVPETAVPWCAGQTDAAPFGLRDPLSTWTLPSVLLRGDSSPRRVLASGLPLSGVSSATFQNASQGSVGAGLAMLALACPGGIETTQFFDAIEGRNVDRKPGASRILLHRMRKTFEHAGEINRRGHELCLVHHRDLALPDPRCATSMADRLLFEVVRAGGAVSSKALAAQQGVSLRVVQQVLQQLTQDGLCRTQRSGREVFYVVEDTTFYEPSVNRWVPPTH